MRSEDLPTGRHSHNFSHDTSAAERGTRWVLGITSVTMLMEIIAGWAYNSMALLADGWHMSSHALAIGLSVVAYVASRRMALDPRFAFGPWKVEVLAAYTSAVLLIGVAALMVWGSVERLLQPQPIRYREALIVAALGLVVNLVCAAILGRAHTHGSGHNHEHAPSMASEHERHHEHDEVKKPAPDLNLRAAYLHVIADAATSVLAILALVGGWFYGWRWLDPVMGIVGATLVAIWARGLIKQSSAVLLDREMDHPVVEEIRTVLESSGEPGDVRVADLHVWRVGRAAFAGAITVVTSNPRFTADYLRSKLSIHEEVAHVTIEVHLERFSLGT